VREKKERRRKKKKKPQGKNIMVCPTTQGDHNELKNVSDESITHLLLSHGKLKLRLSPVNKHSFTILLSTDKNFLTAAIKVS